MSEVRTVQKGQSNPIHCINTTDSNGNPAGGAASGIGMCIAWQDGPRGTNPDGSLGPATGAFVEDALVAAVQRLEYFQRSKFACDANAEAIQHIYIAIEVLKSRADERRARNALGKHVV